MIVVVAVLDAATIGVSVLAIIEASRVLAKERRFRLARARRPNLR